MSRGWKCAICGASTAQPRTCEVCGAVVCPDCAHRWVEGRAVACPSCAETLRDAAGKPPDGGLEGAP